jgi:phosphoheptose isomerase
MKKILITGGADGRNFNEFDIKILKVNSSNVARIQEIHILVGHIIANYIEENF